MQDPTPDISYTILTLDIFPEWVQSDDENVVHLKKRSPVGAQKRLSTTQ
jgi:hypothetical protein